MQHQGGNSRSAPESPNPWSLIRSDVCRTVELNSYSKNCLRLAQEWIGTCVESHQRCRNLTRKLPTRVLVVGPDKQMLRLHHTRDEHGDYVALSHVWGNYKAALTTRCNYKERMKGFPLKSLPKTFRDVVRVTRFLGISYLWIDSLCIIQDDDMDWQSECAEMANVYSNALVTISADDAKDAVHGFLGPRRKANIPVLIPCSPTDSMLRGCDGPFHIHARKQRLGFEDRSHLDLESHNILRARAEPIITTTHTGETKHTQHLLDSRAWTFQERLLSSRTLHFTASEMALECRESINCECSRLPYLGSATRYLFKQLKLGYDYGLMGLEPHPGARFDWMVVVEFYTRRTLTFDRDRLNAIAGIAAAMRLRMFDVYLYGLWKARLIPLLLWSVDPSCRSRRIENFRVPTWTWASVNGEINYTVAQKRWGGPKTKWAELVAMKMKMETANPYGNGRGWITIRGCLGEAMITRMDIGSGCQELSLVLGEGCVVEDWAMKFLPDVTMEHCEVGLGDRVSILVIAATDTTSYSGTKLTRLSCIVLKRVSSFKLHRHIGSWRLYRRIGLVEHHVQRTYRWDDLFKVRDVRIV